MKITVLGGAGAMGGALGAKLTLGGNDVTLLDVSREAVEAIRSEGLTVETKAGAASNVRIKAATDPAAVGDADLVMVFVKCYHTEAAVKAIVPHLGKQSAVLSLQNGWGNAPLIASLVGAGRTLVGVSYHSATLLAPGRVLHAGEGMTFVGELDGAMSERLQRIADCFETAGLEVTPTPTVLKEIWSKLALNACTLPTSALLRFSAGQLVEHDAMLELMRETLREVVGVVRAQGVEINEDERWESITALLKRAATAKSSMLQDVENCRRTEIDVINGAVVAAGRKHGLPTPYNQCLLRLVKSLEGTFSG